MEINGGMSSTAFQTLSFKLLCFLKKAKTNVKAFSFAAINAFPQTIPKERKASRPEEPRLIRAASGTRAGRAGGDLDPRTPVAAPRSVGEIYLFTSADLEEIYLFTSADLEAARILLLLSAPLKQDGGLVRAC